MLLGVLAVLLLCAVWCVGAFVAAAAVTAVVGVFIRLDARAAKRIAVSLFFVSCFGGEAAFLLHLSHLRGQFGPAVITDGLLIALTVGLCRQVWREEPKQPMAGRPGRRPKRRRRVV